MGRVPRARHRARWRGDPDQPERHRPHGALPGRRARGRARGAVALRGDRRRGVRPGRVGRDAVRGAPVGIRAARPDRLRPARARRGAGLRSAARGATEAARGAARPIGRGGAALTRLRGRRCAPRGRAGAGARGRRREARGRARTGPGRRTPEWQKVKLRLQDDLPIVGLHARDGEAGQARRARARASRARRPPLGGERRLGDRGRRRRQAARGAPAARAPDEPARGHPADAARPRLGRDLGRAGAGGRGGLRRADPRGTAASSGVPGVTRRRPGGTPCHGHEDRARSPDARADEPRQAVLAGGGDHQGRAARVLPRRRRGARSPPAPKAVHDEALPRRLAGEELLPEAGAVRTCPTGSRLRRSRHPPARASSA